MAKQNTPPQRQDSKRDQIISRPVEVTEEMMRKKYDIPPPAAPPKEPDPLCATMSCRTCVWQSSGGRCHRYPPTVICPQKDASDFPLLRPGFWCGEHRAR